MTSHYVACLRLMDRQEIKGNQHMARECYMAMLNFNKTLDTSSKETNGLNPKWTRSIVECDHVGMAMLDAREEFVPIIKPNEATKEISLQEEDT